MNEPSMPFDAPLFQSALTTRAVGRFMIYRESTGSTMELARREASEGGPHGALVLAEEQTAGRGRKGRSFDSPRAENLYFTLILRAPLDVHRRLPVILPVAVCSAVAREGVDARIKWPNDIWVGERKLSGMLVDAELADGRALAMPGIGINVNGDPTSNPELAGIATSIVRELGQPVGRELLLARICNEIEETMGLNAEQVSLHYRSLSMILGRRILVTPLTGNQYPATATGILDDGELEVRLDDGTVSQLNAADVTLRPG